MAVEARSTILAAFALVALLQAAVAVADGGSAWTIDGASDDEFAIFGEIKDVVRLDDGRTAILDVQQGLVRLFSPGGVHLRTIHYEGEGPGEARNAMALVPFPPGRVSLVQPRPPKLAMLGLDGLEPGDWALELPDELGGASLLGARSNGQVLAAQLYSLESRGSGAEEVIRLARWTGEESGFKVVAERRESPELSGGVIREFSAPDEIDVWDVDRQGRLLVAPRFDELAVEFWDDTGRPTRRDVVADYESVPRSEDRYDEIRTRYEQMLQFVPGVHAVDVSRVERDIQKLVVLPDGGYGVVSSRVYNPGGSSAPISLIRWSSDGDRLPDIDWEVEVDSGCDLFWISRGYLYVVRGGRSAAAAALRGDAMANAIIGDGPCGAEARVADMTVECHPVPGN